MVDNNQTPDNSQPVDKTTTKKSTKMQKSSTKGDAIDKGHTMTGSKPDKIDMNPEFYHNVNSSFEADFGTPINELNVQQRLKKALNFRKIKSKVQLAKKRAMLRKGTGKVIAKRAKVLAIKMIKSKLAGNRDISSLSPMEKQRVEKLVGRRSDSVNKLALRLIPAVKKKEAKRFLKKESIDLDNLKETVDFINEIVNTSAGGGVRGMGHCSGYPDGESSNYVQNNVNDANSLSQLINQTVDDHNSIHYSDGSTNQNIAPDSDTKDNIMGQKKSGAKVAKESFKYDPNDTHKRDDGTVELVKTFKHDTPGETKSVKPIFKREVKKKIDEDFEAFFECDCEREAMPRSGQNRKTMDNVIRNATSRKVSGGPYRQQSIQKKIIDEQLTILENAVSSIDRGEYDYEGAMAQTQLQTIYRNSKELVDMLKADENMPEWVQSKISLAQDYISCVRDYLLSRKELGESYHVKSHSVYGKVLAKDGEAQLMTYDRAMHHAAKHGGSILKTMSGKKYIVKLPETMDDGHELNPQTVKEDLRNWFNPNHPEGGWKRINSKGEAIGPCARESGEAKPKCMSNEKRAMLTKKERASAVRAKRKYDSNPERKGDPINVSNFGKGKISEAANAAQQAAIAISMKKKGIKPKNEEVEYIDEKNSPTNPALWSKAKALARGKFDVYPSAYANGWAAKWYKSKGGGWKSVSEETIDEVAAWQRKEGKNQEGGLNQKGVDSYRREHPGSHLKTAVTTKPSKLDPDSKAAKRRKSFCARMSGMKKRLTSAKTANDPDSRINKSLRKWNC
jgi:hypothetical protein